MFQNLSTGSTDIFTLNIPILSKIPTPNIPLELFYREFVIGDRVKSVIAGSIPQLFIDQINWKDMYLITFPANLAMVPSILCSTPDGLKICINMQLSTVVYDKSKNTFSVHDYGSFAACVLHGISKMLLYSVDDEQTLSQIYYYFCNFVYTLFIKIYARQYDFKLMNDQQIANMFYAVAKLVGRVYVPVMGNIDAIATIATQKFFTNAQGKMIVKISTSRFPTDVDIQSYQDLFDYFNKENLVSGLSVSDFQNQISRYYSISALYGLCCGLEFGSMLVTLKLNSSIFNPRFYSIRPSSANGLIYSLMKYLSNQKKVNKSPSSFW